MKTIQSTKKRGREWVNLLRWNKPSGRLILLIPACWSLWLTPNSPPPIPLLGLIIIGGFFVSGAGCIANDLWDRKFDRKVARTQNRPLAKGSVSVSTAFFLLGVMLLLSLLVVNALPLESRILCFKIAILAIVPILIYPSAKRWCKYPQAFLALCWGFSVLIPWAASESTLQGGLPLFFCWISTCFWTFGFDTIYAMSDKEDDKKIGLHSSAISLNEKGIPVVSISYGLASLCIGLASHYAGVEHFFWLILIPTSIVMQQEVWILNKQDVKTSKFSNHFNNQVIIGIVILLGIMIGRSS